MMVPCIFFRPLTPGQSWKRLRLHRCGWEPTWCTSQMCMLDLLPGLAAGSTWPHNISDYLKPCWWPWTLLLSWSISPCCRPLSEDFPWASFVLGSAWVTRSPQPLLTKQPGGFYCRSSQFPCWSHCVHRKTELGGFDCFRHTWCSNKNSTDFGSLFYNRHLHFKC